MKICAISDLHGTLPEIRECDAVFICGDIFPLDIDREPDRCDEWFNGKFANWIDKLPCGKVIVIAGNHCFYFESDLSLKTFNPHKENQYIEKDRIPNIISKNNKLKDKLIYLADSEYTFENGIKVYGTPWCISPRGFAFIDSSGIFYNKIPDCDILLTHQPPKVGKLGCSGTWEGREVDYGSEALLNAIKSKNIRYCICGHIHDGTHGGIKLDNCDTVFYNVSIKDDNYNVAYGPLYLEIEKN